jgi:hypothetical protein
VSPHPVAIALTPAEHVLLVRILRECEREDEPLVDDLLEMFENALDVGAVAALDQNQIVEVP